MCVLQHCVAHDSHNEGMCKSLGESCSRAGSQSKSWSPETALQHHETFLIRCPCSFEEHLTVQKTQGPHAEITNAERKQIRMLAELLEACSPDAEGTNIQKIRKKAASTLTIVSQNPCMLLSPLHSFCVSCASWTTNKVSLGGAAHGCPSAAWPAKEPISWWAPNRTVRGSLWHVAHNIHLLSWGRLGHWAMFWEHHKDAAQLLSPSLPAPSSFPRYLYWCALCFPSLPPSLTPAPQLMSRSQLSVLPKSNSCCGLR